MGGLVCAVGALEAYCIKDTDVSQTGVNEAEEVCEPFLTPAVEETVIEDLDLNDVKVEYR